MLKNKFPSLQIGFTLCRRKSSRVFILIFILLSVLIPNVFSQKQFNWELPFKLCWDIPTSVKLNEKVASDNETGITLSITNDLLTSVNPKNGEEIWRTELGGSLGFKPVSDGKNIFLIVNKGSQTLVLRSISPNTGITNWQLEIDTFEKFDGYLFSQYFFAVSQSGLILAIDKSKGIQLWSKRLAGKVHTFNTLVNASGLEEILVSTSGKISELSISDGRLQQEWIIPVGEIEKLLSIDNKKIIWGNSYGDVFCFDLRGSNIVWKVRTGGSISSLATTEKGLLVTSFDNFAYFFSIHSGKLLWKKRLAGRINIKPLIILNYTVIVNSGDSVALIIDLESGKTINQIRIDSSDYFSGSPGIWENLIIFQTFKGIRAFSNLGCFN